MRATIDGILVQNLVIGKKQDLIETLCRAVIGNKSANKAIRND